MKFAIPREREPGETRVALVPDAVKPLVKKGHVVRVERGAGELSHLRDAEYEAAGAQLVGELSQLLRETDCVLKVRAPSAQELELFPEGAALIGFLWPQRNRELVAKLAKLKITSFSMDAMPRITRAQSMDALSSMSTIAGYKAVLVAAARIPKFFPMLTTAAGTIRPAQGLIIGAGVAGLQAIATARRLGAVVEAYDTRPVVKEQVQSLGATFVDVPVAQAPTTETQDKDGYAKEASAELLRKQREVLHQRVKAADFVITTALIPGKPAPRLITREMVADMKAGSVIVDLAAEAGGNCELAQADQEVVSPNGVTVFGPLNLPASMPLDASRMYARNLLSFVNEITGDKGLTFDWNNEVFARTCVTHNGEARL